MWSSFLCFAILRGASIDGEDEDCSEGESLEIDGEDEDCSEGESLEIDGEDEDCSEGESLEIDGEDEDCFEGESLESKSERMNKDSKHNYVSIVFIDENWSNTSVEKMKNALKGRKDGTQRRRSASQTTAPRQRAREGEGAAADPAYCEEKRSPSRSVAAESSHGRCLDVEAGKLLCCRRLPAEADLAMPYHTTRRFTLKLASRSCASLLERRRCNGESDEVLQGRYKRMRSCFTGSLAYHFELSLLAR
nr:hypothetical protein Iba_chr15aCG11090 [Ipomoea batatas]